MITAKQKAVLDFVRKEQAERGVPPSTRAVQRHFRYKSQNSAVAHLRALGRKGLIRQLDGRVWGVAADEIHVAKLLPVFGSIPAGTPDEREQSCEIRLPFDPALLGFPAQSNRKLWGLLVQGDSMIGAQIQNGDLAILERKIPREGDIVAALVDEGSSTLKRLSYKEGRAVLRAENPQYPDIVAQDRIECQGVLVGVVRTIIR